ncbi:MAG TPA: serine/threonine-protein kinase [Thermoleophilaceae bacterium]|nr:serine/threonine-protein kinase [Thermoleophilaceae bacterium]
MVLGRYRLERRIGRGGHGEVWEALDERLERPVALKAVPVREGAPGPRVEREGRVAARLNHPGIVSLYELGSDHDAVYLVSELVRGRTMAELAAAGALSDRDVASIGIALCSALAHAHARGVIHRDVKPQNVIVVAEPAAGAGFAKLTDFGVAHVRDDDTLTRTGDVVGTLAYMAPEQAEGGPVTAAADVYSLALVLYEGWTGSGPDGAVAGRLAGRRPEPLGRISGGALPAPLCRVIDAALDPTPERRPALAELEAELQAAAEVLSDEGGLVEPATRRRFGIPAAPSVGLGLGRSAGWLPRLAAGLGAGCLVLAGLELLSAPPIPAPGLAVGAAVAGVVCLLPRLGWLLAAAGFIGWLASPAGGLQGTALVLLAALAPVPLLLPRAGTLWSGAALGPLLGAAGLAAAFPLLAALAPTVWRRAGLAAAGFGCLVAAELLSGRSLLLGPPEGAAAPVVWESSAIRAMGDALLPVVASWALAPAVAWIAGSALGGLVHRSPSLGLTAAAAVAAAVALVAAHRWIAELTGTGRGSGQTEEILAGAFLGAAALVAVAAARRRREARAEMTFP